MILALGLNVVVGYTGLLHLGIAGFFGIGVYITGILTVPAYPFQVGFCAALVCSTLFTAVCGLILAAPTLRLRGDYVAIVTLGFGEVVRYTLRNLEQITAGTRGLNPVQSPQVPRALVAPLAGWASIPIGRTTIGCSITSHWACCWLTLVLAQPGMFAAGPGLDRRARG